MNKSEFAKLYPLVPESDNLIKINDRAVKGMASEIRYICDKAIGRQTGFKQLVKLLLDKIKTEQILHGRVSSNFNG